MKVSVVCVALGLALALGAPAQAQQDSTRGSSHASGASLGAVSVAPAAIVVLSAYVGGVVVVESVRTVGKFVEVVLRGAADGSRAVVTVTTEAANNSAIASGHTVQVVAQGGGYLLVNAGKVLCFVPGETDQHVLHSKRSS